LGGGWSFLAQYKENLPADLFLEIRKGYTCTHRRRLVTVLISVAERNSQQSYNNCYELAKNSHGCLLFLH
jgi:hypothetical protein